VFHNDGSETIQSVRVSFVGEEWRREANTVLTYLDFQYKEVDAVDVSSGYHIWADTGWTNDPTMEFVAPNVTGVASNLSGNLMENCELLYDVLPVTVAPGQYLVMRWLYASANENTVAGHELGVDDLYVQFRTDESDSFAPPQYFDDTAADENSYNAGNLGVIYSAAFPWLYQNGLGWVYGAGLRGSYFFYVMNLDSLGWIYTSNDVYPYLYDYSGDRWLYQDQSGVESPWFWDFNQNEWVTLQ
jgi:hypothetical protein